MAHFSFNKPDGACPTCTGLGIVHQANLERLVDEEKSIAGRRGRRLGQALHRLLHRDPAGGRRALRLRLRPRRCRSRTTPRRSATCCSTAWRARSSAATSPTIEPPATVRQGRFEGVATNLLRRYAEHIQDADYRDKLDEFLVTQTCPDCAGHAPAPRKPGGDRQRADHHRALAPAAQRAGRLAGRPARRAQRRRDAHRRADPGRPARAHRAGWWKSAPAT